MPEWIEGISRGEAVLGASLFLVLGLFILSLGRIKEEITALRDYSEVFELMGLMTALGAVFLLSFKGVYESFDQGLYIQGDADVAFRVLIGAAGVLTLALVVATTWLHRRNEAQFTLNGIEGVVIAVLLAAAYVVIGVNIGGEVFYAVVFNALLALVLLGVLVSGYMRGRERWMNISLGFIGINVIARYFEYSWDLLDRSFIFVAAGVILLLGGYLVERGRLMMLERRIFCAQGPAFCCRQCPSTHCLCCKANSSYWITRSPSFRNKTVEQLRARHSTSCCWKRRTVCGRPGITPSPSQAQTRSSSKAR